MKTITLIDGTTVKTSATKLAELKRAFKEVRENNSAHMNGGNAIYTGYAKVMIFETFAGELDFSIELRNTFYTTWAMQKNGWKRNIQIFNSWQEEEDFCR